MEHTEGTFQGTRGLEIYYQTWLPEGDPKAAIIIVHGLGEHSGRYDNVVDHMVPLGYAVYGFDLPGHGKSDGTREFVEQFKDYSDTLTTYRKMVEGWQSGKPIFLLGHSMGGLITTQYLIGHSKDFSGAVISAPAITVPENITQMTITLGKLFSKIAPKLGVMALDANMISKDPAVVEKYVHDPLVFHDKTTARLSAELLKTMMQVDQDMEKITVPMVIVQGSEDKLANPQGAKTLYAQAGSMDKTLKIYDGLFHEVFNEPEKALVLSEVASWLEAHV